MKKSLKALFMASMLPVMMLMAAVTLTSCEGMLDDIFGEWSRPTNQQNNEPTEDEIEAAQIREAIAMLEEAQKEGSITTMYFTVSGTDYEATFKKVGTEFVLQELKSTKAATRAGDDLEAKLELIEVEDDGDDEGDYDDGDEDGDDDDGDDDGDDEEGDDDEEDDPDDGTTWYDVDDSSDEDGGSGADTRSNEIHKVSGTRGNVPVDLGMPVASNQEMHFTVTSKTTGEMLINFHTNMGNSETTQECGGGTVSTFVQSKTTINGKTITLGSGNKECKIKLPNGNLVILKYKKNKATWKILIKNKLKLSINKEEGSFVMYDKKYWVLNDGNAVKKGDKVRSSNKSSTIVKELSLSTNVENDVYSDNIDKNSFRKGDKIRVKVKLNKGAKMRDAFSIKDATSSVSVSKVEGKKNVFDIEAVEEPSGSNELKEFSVTFAYEDYNGKYNSKVFTGYIKLDKTSDQAAAEKLYAEIDDDGLKITDEVISNFVSISKLVGDFVDAAAMISEAYAKALAEKICKEKNLGGVVLFMGGNDTKGYDFYVISDDSNSKTHLAFDAAIPATWEGLTLFFVSKSTSSE